MAKRCLLEGAVSFVGNGTSELTIGGRKFIINDEALASALVTRDEDGLGAGSEELAAQLAEMLEL